MSKTVINKHIATSTGGGYTSSDLQPGEIGINYQADRETISIRNSNGGIIDIGGKYSPKNQYIITGTYNGESVIFNAIYKNGTSISVSDFHQDIENYVDSYKNARLISEFSIYFKIRFSSGGTGGTVVKYFFQNRLLKLVDLTEGLSIVEIGGGTIRQFYLTFCSFQHGTGTLEISPLLYQIEIRPTGISINEA